jgi:DNA-binding winged helix-turn-helix (wHTH) protein
MYTSTDRGPTPSDSDVDTSKLESRRYLRFGPFELRIDTRELSKSGTRVKLQNKSAQVLGALVSRPDELVRREELYAVLWPGNVFVDFHSGLNTAVNRLRSSLGDTAESPLYIETLPRLGYRFICPVQEVSTESPEVGAADCADQLGKTVFTHPNLAANALRSALLWRLAVATVLALACEFLFFWLD